MRVEEVELAVITVLVVDDEKWMREEIASSVDWEQNGLKLVGEAGDGVEALAMIRNINPDIVLADIKMPGMDGIELLKRVRESGLNTVFIFFSGYDRFDYARSAVNLGAFGYVLKPVDEKELLELLARAKMHITDEREKLQSSAMLADLSGRELKRMQKEFLEGLLYRAASLSKELVEEMSRLQIRLHGGYFTVITCEIDGFGSGPAENLKQTLRGLVESVLGGLKLFYFAVDVNKGITAILNYCTGDMDMRTSLIEACDRIRTSFWNNTGSTVTIGIGIEALGIEGIHASFDDSRKAVEYRLVAGNNRVIDIAGVGMNKIRTVILDPRLEKRITDCIERKDILLMADITGQVSKYLHEGKLDLEDVKHFNYHFVELVYRIQSRKGPAPEVLFGNPHVLCDEMDTCESIEELAFKISSILSRCCQAFAESSPNYYKRLVESIKKYLEEHYMEDLSLESVANEFKFHPNYFSKLFKDETGENFIDFLTEVRINIARGLLKDMRNTVNDVAQKVGYKDPKYFTKVFKKVVGLTPSEYIGKK